MAQNHMISIEDIIDYNNDSIFASQATAGVGSKKFIVRTIIFLERTLTVYRVVIKKSGENEITYQLTDINEAFGKYNTALTT